MLSVRIFFVVYGYNIGGSIVYFYYQSVFANSLVINILIFKMIYFSTYTKVKRVDIVRNFAPDKKQNPNLC